MILYIRQQLMMNKELKKTKKKIKKLKKYKKELEKQLGLCGVGKQLNDLGSNIDSFVNNLPKLKLFYDGSVSYDGNTYKDVSDLIDNYQKLK